MLTVNIETETGVQIKKIIVIDSHSHLGKDVDGAEMMNPGVAGGTFDFWSQLEGLIKLDWKNTEEQCFETRIGGKDHILTFSFEKMPFVDKIFSQLETIQSANFRDLSNKSDIQNFVDQAVVFPFQDTFRNKMPEALYRASNLNISRFTTRFPYSMRLIGYMRVDPMEGNKAVKEVEYGATQLGLRGLKLHPRSEQWIDNMNSQKAVNVLVEAAKYSLPVLFDTRGKRSIVEIGNLIKSTRTYLQNSAPHLLQSFKVIIAHFAQGNVGDEEVYRTICQPNTWGDLSMLHGKGAAMFFKSFRNWFAKNNMVRVDGRTWSEYLLFATDYPYFGGSHAKGLIINLISQEFYNSGGTIKDTENILGLNQLKLLPEYNIKFTEKKEVPALSSVISTLDPAVNSLDIAIRAIARLIDSGTIDISRLLYQFDGDFSNYKGEVLISTKSIQDRTKTINLVVTNLIKDKLTMLSTLAPGKTWKKLGFKYFNMEDREFFHSVLAQSRPANNEEDVFQMIKQAY